tara:strand:+ start:2077 stop:2520 length:444 start_codon:yes stop_codon:yes gene_type:complete
MDRLPKIDIEEEVKEPEPVKIDENFDKEQVMFNSKRIKAVRKRRKKKLIEEKEIIKEVNEDNEYDSYKKKMLGFEQRFKMEQEEKKKKENEIRRVKLEAEEKKKVRFVQKPVEKKISKPVDIPHPRKPKIPDYIRNLPPSLRKMYGY